ncbi:MAG: chemotaxis protein CheX [Oscillospiraceae bacterium]|nr:chemotaxis protein CheX [Oscillospiraceae bacterium]
MDIAYINPFIEASQVVIKQAANYQVRLGKVFVRSKPYEIGCPLIEVGLIGEIDGKAILCIPLQIALFIISQMMMGMEVTKIDEIGQSALKELANMVMGNTATILYNKGIGIDISTPKMMYGDGNLSTPRGMKTVSIPMILDDLGAIELDISFQE